MPLSSPPSPSGQAPAASVLTIRPVGGDGRPTDAQTRWITSLLQVMNQHLPGACTYSERPGGVIGITNHKTLVSTYMRPNGEIFHEPPDAPLSSAGAVEDTSMATTQQEAVNRSAKDFIDAWKHAPLADCLTPAELQQVRSDVVMARCQQHQPADPSVYQAEVNGYLDLLFKQKLESFFPTDASQPTDITEQVKKAVANLI